MAVVVEYPLAAAAAAATSAAAAELGAPPFALRGIVTPFRRDQKNDFANDVGVNLIRSNVRQILMTKGATDKAAGEIPWLTEFGSQLHTLRHSNSSVVLEELARVFVIEALRRFEPRVRVSRTRVERISSARRIELTVLFDIIDLQAPAATILVPNLAETVPVLLAA